PEREEQRDEAQIAVAIGGAEADDEPFERVECGDERSRNCPPHDSERPGEPVQRRRIRLPFRREKPLRKTRLVRPAMPKLDEIGAAAAALLEFRDLAGVAFMAHLAVDFDELLEGLRPEIHAEMPGRLPVQPLLANGSIVSAASRHSIVRKAVQSYEGGHFVTLTS